MTVTLMNVFIVPPGKENEFLDNWRKTTEVFKLDPGFVETHLHKNTGVGNTTFQFINYAKWRSPEDWKRAHDAYRPTEYAIEGVKGHPSIYQSVIDVYGVAEAGETIIEL